MLDIDERYKIDPYGNIFSNKTNRLLKPHKCAGDYIQVFLNGKRRYLHIVVAEHYVPKIEGKPEINHKDGNKSNNHFSNLEWVDRSENIIHAYASGLHKGRFGVCFKEHVKDIIDEYKEGTTQERLAKKYNTSGATINRILNGKIKKYVIFSKS